mgnify:CR=1 FL=1
MSVITAETLARLRAFDTPTICNLIELFEVRPRNTGYMDQISASRRLSRRCHRWSASPP